MSLGKDNYVVQDTTWRTLAWQQSVSDVAALKADVIRDTQQHDLTQVFSLQPRQTE